MNTKRMLFTATPPPAPIQLSGDAVFYRVCARGPARRAADADASADICSGVQGGCILYDGAPHPALLGAVPGGSRSDRHMQTTLCFMPRASCLEYHLRIPITSRSTHTTSCGNTHHFMWEHTPLHVGTHVCHSNRLLVLKPHVCHSNRLLVLKRRRQRCRM